MLAEEICRRAADLIGAIVRANDTRPEANDLSRYEPDGAEPEEPLRLAGAESEPLRLTGADDPDAVEDDDDDDDDVVSSGAGGRRRSRRGTRRRTRP